VKRKSDELSSSQTALSPPTHCAGTINLPVEICLIKWTSMDLLSLRLVSAPRARNYIQSSFSQWGFILSTWQGLEPRIFQFTALALCSDWRLDTKAKFLQRIDWKMSKRLLYGSLICLSNDGFNNNLLFATVANRENERIKKEGMLQIMTTYGHFVPPKQEVHLLTWQAKHHRLSH